jgi:multiple sugar transport system substrate-binding protein
VDNDIMRETLTWMRSLVWEHEVLSPNFMERSYTVFDDFVADAVAMVGSVSDTVGTDLERDFPELDGRWEMAIPALGPDNRSSYSGAGYWGLLYGTPRVEESLQWLSFLSRDENMQRVTEFIGRVSPNKAVMASDYWQDRPWKVVITETLNHAHTSQHPSPAWGVMVAGEPGGILYDMYFDAIVRQEDLDDVLARTQSRMQEEMDKVDF